MRSSHINLLIPIIIICFSVNTGFGQISDEEAIIFHSNNDYLYDIVLAQFNDKARLGSQDYNKETNSYKRANLIARNRFYFGNKRTDIIVNTDMYMSLLQMKFLKKDYDQMQTKLPTAGIPENNIRTNRNSLPEEDRSYQSQRTQEHLHRAVNELINKKGLNKFLCNGKRPCKKRIGMSDSWGGIGVDEFAQVEAFQVFIKTVYPDLRKWSETINTEAVLVEPIRLPEYNFEEGGFKVNLYPSPYGRLVSDNNPAAYEPVEPFEQALVGKQSFYKFWKVNPEKAKEIRAAVGRSGSILAVYEIKFHGIDEKRGPSLRAYSPLLFHFSSPTITFYLDKKLKQKLGGIKL